MRSVVRGEQLFAKAKALQAKLEAKRAAAPEECTFTPELVAKRVDTPKSSDSAKKPRSHRLYEAGVQSQTKLATQRAAAEQATPSFKPVLVARKPASVERADGSDVFSSLYSRGMKQRQRRSETTPEDKECTFTPQTTKKARRVKGSARRRLYDADKLKAKALEREALREKHETENCTFAPAINTTGAAADKTAEKRTAVYNKLFEDAKKTQAKLVAAAAAAEAKEKAELTFKPAINRGSAKSPVSREGPVGDRLYRRGVESAARRKATHEAAGMEGCTFKPQISKRSPAKGKTAEGAELPVHERLFKQAQDKPRRTDAGEPRIAWQTLLRPEGEEVPTVKPVKLTAEQQATFDRLYSQAAARAGRSGTFQEKPDWELLLREEKAREAEAESDKVGAVPVDAEAAAKQAALYERLFAEAGKKAGASGAGGVVSFETTLRKPAAAGAGTAGTKKVDAAAVATGDRLSKATLESRKVADMEAAAADEQATMLRTCWHATLRTEHPVATTAYPVEAV